MVKQFKIPFTVRGGGEFPMDMLRYDNCVPASAEDQKKISWRYEDGLPDGSRGLYRREVNLIGEFPYKISQPIRARWNSFGWKVVKVGEDDGLS